MPIVLNTTTSKVVDLSQAVNLIENEAKQSVMNLLKRFDFETTNEKYKTKHYPLSYTCDGSPEEIATALERISSACWRTLLGQLQVIGMTARTPLPLKAYAYSEGPKPRKLNVKLGKIYMCSPNRFSHVNKDVEEVKLFAFGYQFDDEYEVTGEINFGIEIY
jgi:hypothetical protein